MGADLYYCATTRYLAMKRSQTSLEKSVILLDSISKWQQNGSL
ncbi:MAG: hypothetical protein SWJ54_15180 [Cyanobacteriota bacterium]|nr:hypothetical protein [Cyanobacteriota bacterium]